MGVKLHKSTKVGELKGSPMGAKRPRLMRVSATLVTTERRLRLMKAGEPEVRLLGARQPSLMKAGVILRQIC